MVKVETPATGTYTLVAVASVIVIVAAILVVEVETPVGCTYAFGSVVSVGCVLEEVETEAICRPLR
jgi:hypothetical protein